MSYRRIAEASGVADETVRRSVTTFVVTQPEFVTGKDGKQYPAYKQTRGVLALDSKQAQVAVEATPRQP